MFYVIGFENPCSALLHRDGQRVSYTFDDAMTFKDQEAAFQYIEQNKTSLKPIGEGASPSGPH